MKRLQTQIKMAAIVFGLGALALTGCETTSTVTPNNTEELGGSIGTRTLDPAKIYIIDRFAYVDDGDILTIPAGTIIKANTGDGADASALIIARGGKILANGNAAKPIIFTSVDDDIQPGETESSLDPASDAGKWGGLIILGRAPISAQVSKGDTVTSIEGVPDVFEFSKYGGSIPNDNSGILNYVSIRFTGTKLATNDEIQGLTLGGVGSGTTITNIEIISSDDDGIEIFGGSVNVSNILISYQTDDGIDIDQSYSGTVDNATVLIYNPNVGNDAFEFDGPEGPSNANGTFTVSNVTVINKGAGNCRAGTLKSGAQGTITDCAFIDFNNFFYVDGGSATSNYVNGDLKILDSQFDIATLADAIDASADAATIDGLFTGDGNTATTTFTKGSTANFGWTFASSLGLLD